MLELYSTEAAFYGRDHQLRPSTESGRYKFYPTLRLPETHIDDSEYALKSEYFDGTRLPNVACVFFSSDPVSDPKAGVLVGNDSRIPLLVCEEEITASDRADVLVEETVASLGIACDDICVTLYHVDLNLRPWDDNLPSVSYDQIPLEDMHEDYAELLPEKVRSLLMFRQRLLVISGIAIPPFDQYEPKDIEWTADQKNFGVMKSSTRNLKINPALGREATLVTFERWRELE